MVRKRNGVTESKYTSDGGDAKDKRTGYTDPDYNPYYDYNPTRFVSFRQTPKWEYKYTLREMILQADLVAGVLNA